MKKPKRAGKRKAATARPQPQKPGPRRGKFLASAGVLIVALLIVWIGVSGSGQSSESPEVRRYSYDIINAYPHDPEAFTQGLLYRDGVLYESTGLNGRSSVRRVDLETGAVLDERSVDPEFFAEGLADWDDTLIQLTWHAGIGFVYDIGDFSIEKTFRYPGEGWGLARDGNRLVMSDGSSNLRFLDTETFVETGRVTVTESGRPISNLNELEVVNGQILANIWLTDEIAVIDPETGRVVGRIDLGGLLTTAERTRGVDVLNGIAYDAEGERLFVTGKLWPRLFEIRLQPR